MRVLNKIFVAWKMDKDIPNGHQDTTTEFLTDAQDLEILFTITFHYEQEIQFYEKLSNRVKLRTPHCYYSDIDIEAQKYILLIEEMALIRGGDFTVGCSPGKTEPAIHPIPGFHATWLESPELEKMLWMHQYGKAQISRISESYQITREPFYERMGSRLPDQILGIGDRIGRLFD
jgi:hypothetical protein